MGDRIYGYRRPPGRPKTLFFEVLGGSGRRGGSGAGTCSLPESGWVLVADLALSQVVGSPAVPEGRFFWYSYWSLEVPA